MSVEREQKTKHFNIKIPFETIHLTCVPEKTAFYLQIETFSDNPELSQNNLLLKQIKTLFVRINVTAF